MNKHTARITLVLWIALLALVAFAAYIDTPPISPIAPNEALSLPANRLLSATRTVPVRPNTNATLEWTRTYTGPEFFEVTCADSKQTIYVAQNQMIGSLRLRCRTANTITVRALPNSGLAIRVTPEITP